MAKSKVDFCGAVVSYSMVELIICRTVSLCIEMPGNSYQDPPTLWLITESSM
jgi:hypothetical protein